MIELVVITLVLMLVGSNLFWANVFFKMSNRLMSRNYAELKQAETKPIYKKPELVDDGVDEFAIAQAAELNALLGTV